MYNVFIILDKKINAFKACSFSQRVWFSVIENETKRSLCFLNNSTKMLYQNCQWLLALEEFACSPESWSPVAGSRKFSASIWHIVPSSPPSYFLDKVMSTGSYCFSLPLMWMVDTLDHSNLGLQLGLNIMLQIIIYLRKKRLSWEE